MDGRLRVDVAEAKEENRQEPIALQKRMMLRVKQHMRQ